MRIASPDRPGDPDGIGKPSGDGEGGVPFAKARRAIHDGWYWGVDYGWATRSIGDGLLHHRVPPRYARGSLSPALLIPGVLEDWTMMRPVADRLSAAGHPVHVLPELKHNTATVVQASDLAVAYLVAHDLSDVVVVAHSKGGLIAKRLLLGAEAWRVRTVVALAAPFAGSVLARLIPSRAVRAMGPDDPTILELASHPEVNDKITSIYPRFDPHVPGGSHLDGAVNIPVETVGHFRILDNAQALDAVISASA